MSSLFSVLGIACSGVDAMQTWLDAAGGNIANANDVVSPNQKTYADELTLLSPTGAPGQAGMGVQASVVLGPNSGVLAYAPNNPLANAQGDVKYPQVSTSHELVNLIQAQDAYQANTSVMQKAISAYRSGLTIGS
ncbi:MAG TPA: flagellar basal body rod C-terminal domain-containing protein [Acidimicrobiales bacterium]|nr:flagellar basal body rod C-terminal domain-containing protein [Acidimicrobiales bacterium]